MTAEPSATDRPIEAVVLDMDGVITRTATLHARVWKQMFDEYLSERGRREGQSYEPFDSGDDYARYVDGKPRYDGVRSFLQARNIELPEGSPEDPPSEETVCGLGNRKNELFHELIDHVGVEVYPDTLEQLERWKQQGIKLGVISSSRNCPEILLAAGVLDRFEVKVDGNDLARLGIEGKPAPDIFLHAASLLGVSPQRTMIVEDAFAGVQAGRAGGFAAVVGVARDGDADELKRNGADVVVRDLRDLETAIAPARRRSPAPALERLDEITGRLADQRLALFLDYDGTLTPIVDRPEDAVLSDVMRSLLRNLAGCCTVAIISGRDLADVRRMVDLDLVYAGSHGYDIAGPDGLKLQHEEARQRLPDLAEAEQELHARLDSVEGVKIERKHFAVAVHYRLAADDEREKIEAAVSDIQRSHPGLRKKGGKKIFELQPDVPWHKGRALLWLRETLGLDRPDVLTMYLGDDETDEDAFAVLAERQIGLGIYVGRPDSGTGASFYLEDCAEVQRFLEALLSRLQRS